MLGMFLTVATFANGIVTYTDAANAEQAKTEGVFNFSFDASFSVDEINKTANYYESYFSVTPVASPSGITVVIKLVEDNEMSRRVVTRFFVSLEVKEILVDGTAISIDDFIAKYVMR